MLNNSRVSVVLTSFNHAKYLTDAIDSVLSQTFSDFELIVWDDVSTDGSWDIIQSYTDARIRAFRNDKNLGGGNLKRAIVEAKGQFIAIHHSDDLWLPDKLEKQVAFLDENPEIGAVFSWAQIIDENGDPFDDANHFYNKIFEQPNRTRYEWLNYFFNSGNALCHPSVVVRKEVYDAVGLYRTAMAQAPDFDMWVRLALKYGIHVIPEKLVRFRIHGDQNTSTYRPDTHIRSQFEYLQVLNNYRKISNFRDLKRIFPEAQKYDQGGDEDLEFILGMIAVSNEKGFSFTKLFGLMLLFEAINNPVREKKIRELYNFSRLDFIELTGKHDVFSVEVIRDLQTFLAERDAQLAERDAQLAERDAQLAERDSELFAIKSSRTWKAMMAVGKMRALLRSYVLLPLRLYRKNKIKRELELLRSSELFDNDLYLMQNPDVVDANMEPVEHYLLHGWKEGRDPSLDFSTQGYLNAYPDVRAAGLNPLVHYLVYGMNETNMDTKKRMIVKLKYNLKRALVILRQDGLMVMFQKMLEKVQYTSQSYDNVDVPYLSIIIPVYNALDMTKACLSSVYKEMPENYHFEILLIDNASRDGTSSWIKKYQKDHPNLIYLRMEKNIGFGPAVNKGIQKSRGEYVVILNNDTIVSSGWLEKLFSVFEVDNSVGIVSPMTNYVGEGPQIDTNAIELPPEPDLINEYSSSIADRNEIFYEPNRLVFFCVMIRREVVDLIGGLDEGYQMGNFEDDDYCLRTRMAGYKLAVAKNSFVYHHGSFTFKKNKISHTHWMENNRQRFYGKAGRIALLFPLPVPYDNLEYKKKLSVIVRTKDRPYLLKRALTSLANQTCREFDVLVVNDGGEDISLLLDEYRLFFPINYIYHQESKGRTAAINAGLHNAKGTWVGYLDDDDIVYPWHFENLLLGADQASADVVYSDCNRSLFTDIQSSSPVRLVGIPSWEYDRNELLVQNYLPIHSYIHKRECLEHVGYWDETFDRLEDYDFLMRLSALYDFCHVPKVTCEYRFYLDAANSISAGRAGYLIALRKLYGQYPVDDEELEYERRQVLDTLEKQTKKIDDLLQNAEKTDVEKLAVQREIVRLTTGM
jgi:GT2 family glycosyltransferase